MRLICPNCDAQYEVDDSVIPEEGRDVQCSNCGQTWFQSNSNVDLETDDEVTDQDHVPSEATEEAHSDMEKTDEPAEVTGEPEQIQAEEESEDSHEAKETSLDHSEDDENAEAEETPEDVHRRTLDEAVLDVLREEANLETSARKAEGGTTIETQPDLGLQESDDTAGLQAAAIKERTARLRGEEPEPAEPGHRSDLLPDIEEINSTLRSASERDDDGETEAEAEVQQRSKGFRLGFGIILALFALGIGIYAAAPQIAEAVPQTKPALIAYVDWVNGLRLWMDNALGRAVTMISGATE